MFDSLQPHGLSPSRFLCPWNSSSSLSLLQGIFLTQGSNLGLPHRKHVLYHLTGEDLLWGCNSEVPHAGWLKHEKLIFLMFLEVGSPKARWMAEVVAAEALSLACRRQLLSLFSWLSLWVCLRPLLLFSQRQQSSQVRAHPRDLI